MTIVAIGALRVLKVVNSDNCAKYDSCTNFIFGTITAIDSQIHVV